MYYLLNIYSRPDRVGVWLNVDRGAIRALRPVIVGHVEVVAVEQDLTAGRHNLNTSLSMHRMLTLHTMYTNKYHLVLHGAPLHVLRGHEVAH